MATPATKAKQVQTFGRKRAAVAVALCKAGKGLLRLNGQPMHLLEPAMMRIKTMEPVLLLGRDKFAGMDIRVRVKGGGHSSQVYAVRQAIAKAVIAYAQKCESGGGGRWSARGAGSARATGGAAAVAAAAAALCCASEAAVTPCPQACRESSAKRLLPRAGQLAPA